MQAECHIRSPSMWRGMLAPSSGDLSADGIMDMDTQMRAEGVRSDVFGLAAAVLFDFTVAFPNVDNSFLLPCHASLRDAGRCC